MILREKNDLRKKLRYDTKHENQYYIQFGDHIFASEFKAFQKSMLEGVLSGNTNLDIHRASQVMRVLAGRVAVHV